MIDRKSPSAEGNIVIKDVLELSRVDGRDFVWLDAEAELIDFRKL